jgi:hypothetical protein
MLAIDYVQLLAIWREQGTALSPLDKMAIAIEGTEVEEDGSRNVYLSALEIPHELVHSGWRHWPLVASLPP